MAANSAIRTAAKEEDHHTAGQGETSVELDRLVDAHHPLVLLSEGIDWRTFERALLSPEEQLSAAARQQLRMTLALDYLKQKYQLSDLEVIRKAQTNPYWQHFCGMRRFTRSPITTPDKMEHWRGRIRTMLSRAEVRSMLLGEMRAKIMNAEMFGLPLFGSSTPLNRV